MDIDFEAQAFTRHLRAEGKSEQTVKTYLKAINALKTYLSEHGPDDTTKTAIEEFLGYELARGLSKQTVHQHHASLRVFFRWWAAEAQGRSPMDGVGSPSPDTAPVPVLLPEHLRRLFDACRGTAFEARRDLALLSLLADTGIRRSECSGLQVLDLDLAEQLATVSGKTGTRAVPYGRSTAERIDRYLRIRREHRHAALPHLWLGAKGPLTAYGLEDMVARRGRQAGVTVHPHMFRHTFAHMWLDGGGNEIDLQKLAGWKSGVMLQRYGASAASARARRAFLAGRSPVDKL